MNRTLFSFEVLLSARIRFGAPDVQPFSSRRGADRRWLGYGPLREGAKDTYVPECPLECRPKEHQDWVYC